MGLIIIHQVAAPRSAGGAAGASPPCSLRTWRGGRHLQLPCLLGWEGPFLYAMASCRKRDRRANFSNLTGFVNSLLYLYPSQHSYSLKSDSTRSNFQLRYPNLPPCRRHPADSSPPVIRSDFSHGPLPVPLAIAGWNPPGGWSWTSGLPWSESRRHWFGVPGTDTACTVLCGRRTNLWLPFCLFQTVCCCPSLSRWGWQSTNGFNWKWWLPHSLSDWPSSSTNTSC